MKTKFFPLVLFLLFLLLTCHANAQNIQIKGKVVENNNGKRVVVPALTVILKTPDSVFVKGVTTDIEGQFKLDNVRSAQYILTLSGIGYETYFLNIDKPTSNYDCGTVAIKTESKLLSEVVVKIKS